MPEKSCPKGQEVNLSTKRCWKICSRSPKTQRCMTPCKNGYERHSATNRCRKLRVVVLIESIVHSFSAIKTIPKHTQEELYNMVKSVESVVSELPMIDLPHNILWDRNSCYIDAILMAFFAPGIDVLNRVLVPPLVPPTKCGARLRGALFETQKFINGQTSKFRSGIQPVRELRALFFECKDTLGEYLPDERGNYGFNSAATFLYDLLRSLYPGNTRRLPFFTIAPNIEGVADVTSFVKRMNSENSKWFVVEIGRRPTKDWRAKTIQDVLFEPVYYKHLHGMSKPFHLISVVYFKNSHYTTLFKHNGSLTFYLADGMRHNLIEQQNIQKSAITLLIYVA